MKKEAGSPMDTTNLRAERPGSFVVFEGPDGVGKTSAMKELARRLRTKGVEVVETRNVGGTPTAEAIRAITLDPGMRLDPIQQNMLIAAARRSNLIEVVIPALDRGALVLCDRYVASALVFQTLNREGGVTIRDQDVLAMHRMACDSFAPDLMIHMHAPAEVRAERRRIRAEGHDRFDNGDAEYDAAIARKYALAGDALGHRTIDVDASGTPEETVVQIERAVAPYATDAEHCVVEYRLRHDRSGRWMPVLDGDGFIFRTSDRHVANDRCNTIWKAVDGSAQLRIVPRSVAMEAVRGLTTNELDSRLRGR
jgi:dTMP kinase